MKKLFTLAFSLILTTTLFAQDLTILSGLEGGAYNQFANDIKKVSSQEIKVLTSGGSIENYEKLLADDNIQFTFLQYDVLAEKEKENPAIKKSIQIFQPIVFLEDIHLFAKAGSGILTLDNLAGKKVAVGSLTQGTRFTALNIKKATGIEWEDVEMNSNDALQALLDGKIDAFFYVGASPIPSIKALPAETQAQLQLVSLKHKKFPYTYIPQKIKAGTYEFVKEDVYVFSVLTLFVVRVYQGEVNDNVEKLYQDLDENIKTLMGEGHKKWEDAYENFRKAMLQWPLYVSDPGE